MKIHPGDLLLDDILCGLVRHESLALHLATCERCQSKVGGLSLLHDVRMRMPTPGAARAMTGANLTTLPALQEVRECAAVDYGAAIERSERKYLERAGALHEERGEAPALLAELLSVRPEKRKLLLANSARFQTWGIYELLLERSWKARASRSEAEELARLAIELSAHLDATYYRSELIEDLLARAWSYVANIRRLADDFSGAEEAFDEAYKHLKLGTHEALERAVFLDLKASLRVAQRRLDEAIRLLRRCVAIFLRQGDDHRAGKSQVNLANAYFVAGEPENAIGLLQDSLRLIDPAQDERLLLCAWSNLINAVTDMGRFIEARGLYGKARTLYRKYDDDAFYGSRRLWTKGKIERGLGQADSAEALFLAARDRFLADGLPYEAALVSLELAILYAEQERTAELKRLATEMLPIFASRQIHREALAALMFLERAAAAERLGIEVAGRIADFLRRAQADPSFKFEAPA